MLKCGTTHQNLIATDKFKSLLTSTDCCVFFSCYVYYLQVLICLGDSSI